MKRVFFVFFPLLFVAFSCGTKVDYNTLGDSRPSFDMVYTLKETYPDSAYHLLCALTDTLFLEDIKHYTFQYAEYQVLLAELEFKSFRPISNEEEVLHAFDFYDSVVGLSCKTRHDADLNFQLARAQYYKGVVEGQRGQSIEAFNDFLKSLYMMDGLTGTRRAFSFRDTNPNYEHFTALIYDRLASYLYLHDAWEVALDALELSNECFRKEGFLYGIAGNLEMMGNVMLAQSNQKDAIGYYKQSDSIHAVIHTDNVYQQFSTLIHKSYDLYYDDNKDSAYRLMHNAMYQTKNVYLQRRIGYALGFFYYEDQILDSAMSNYERSYPLLPRQTLKSYSRCVQISNALGDSLKAARYGNLLADYCLSRMKMDDEKTAMITLYEKFQADKRMSRQRDWFYFIFLLVVLLGLVLTIDSIHLYRRRKRQERDRAEHERIKASLEDKIEMTEEMARLKEEKIKVLETELEKRLSNPDFQKLPFDKKLETLYEMPISKRVRKVMEANVKAFSSYPELVLSENQLTMVVNAVDAVFPKFSVRIIEMYPRLKRSDVIYCCFYILGITEVQAAALMGKSYQAVWTRSLKLHEIFDNKASLQFVLHDLLKSWQSIN